jgi:hypothetical protein
MDTERDTRNTATTCLDVCQPPCPFSPVQFADMTTGKDDSLQRALDYRCTNAVCNQLKTQSSEEAMRCTLPQNVEEDVDGCKYALLCITCSGETDLLFKGSQRCLVTPCEEGRAAGGFEVTVAKSFTGNMNTEESAVAPAAPTQSEVNLAPFHSASVQSRDVPPDLK